MPFNSKGEGYAPNLSSIDSQFLISENHDVVDKRDEK